MIADRVGHGIGQPFGAGVIAAHQALQFGEFADHFGDQIGLAQPRCQFGLIGIRAFDNAFFHQPAGQFRHPFHLVRHSAELFVEGNPLQPPGVFLQGFLAVHIPEEPRIGKARGQNLAVAIDNGRAAVCRLDIGGADEGVGKGASAVFAHEIFLVHPRGQLDHFGRYFEEIFFEPAQQRDRPFGQAGVFHHQPFIVHQHQSGIGSSLRGAGADHALTLCMINDDMAGAQLFRIIIRAANGDRAGMMEAVAHRGVTCGHAVHFAFDQRITKNGDNTGQRAHPAQAFGAD